MHGRTGRLGKPRLAVETPPNHAWRLVAIGADPAIGPSQQRILVAYSRGDRSRLGLHVDARGAVLVYDPSVGGARARAIAAATAWIACENAAGRRVDFLFVEVDPDPDGRPV
jgi:hypothetical protein